MSSPLWRMSRDRIDIGVEKKSCSANVARFPAGSGALAGSTTHLAARPTAALGGFEAETLAVRGAHRLEPDSVL